MPRITDLNKPLKPIPFGHILKKKTVLSVSNKRISTEKKSEPCTKDVQSTQQKSPVREHTNFNISTKQHQQKNTSPNLVSTMALLVPWERSKEDESIEHDTNTTSDDSPQVTIGNNTENKVLPYEKKSKVENIFVKKATSGMHEIYLETSTNINDKTESK